MVDPTDPIKHGAVHKQPKQPPKPEAPKSDYQGHHSGKEGGIAVFFKKMLPGATPDQIKQIVNNFTKVIADQIQRDQKFHEDQREQRKEESGDDDI